MINYIIRRLLLMIPTLFGITAIVYFTMALSPGATSALISNAAGEMKAGDRAQLEQMIRKKYHLDEPVFFRYLRWVNDISPIGFVNARQLQYTADRQAKAQGKRIGHVQPEQWYLINRFRILKWPDFGYSYSQNRPVINLIAEALPITLLLNIITIPVVYIIAVPCGVYMAKFRGRFFDRAAGTTFLGLWSLPIIWVGVMLIGFLASKQYLHWFPVSGLHSQQALDMPYFPSWTEDGQFQLGFLLDMCWHLVLPIVCLTYGGFAYLSKIMRGAVLENLAADYVRTARAKGVDDRTVLFHHVMRNSLIPLITMAAGILPALLGGAVIVERIFTINGMGLLSLNAIYARDHHIVLTVTLLAGIIGLTSRLIADVMYAVADPRISYE